MILTRRSIFFAAALLLSLATRSFAQITRDTTHWNDEELYNEEDKAAPAFFSVGGGFLAGYFHPDFSSFNATVAQPFVGQNYREQVFMFGGAGFVTIPWIKNLRIGGMGYSGTSSDCGCVDVPLPSDTSKALTANRYLTYSVGYGALTIDYVLPLRTGRFHIVPGIALGMGSVDIYKRQAQNRAGFDSASFANEFNAQTWYTTHTYSSHFFIYMPQLQFEYAPLGYLMFRLTAAYQGTSMGTWTVDNGLSLGTGTLLNNINGNGLVASLGVFLGLFQ